MHSRRHSDRLVMTAAAALLLTAFVLCGCGLADLALWLGKWEDGRGFVDFKMDRFVLRDRFAGGFFLVSGTYEIDPNKFPKRVDFRAEKVVLSFSEDGYGGILLSPGSGEEAVLDALRRVAVFADAAGDDAVVRLLTVFAQSLLSGRQARGIYHIALYTGTYLKLELNRPDDERPKEFGLSYVRREY